MLDMTDIIMEKTMKGIGQNFNDFLKEQGIYDEVNELAAKKLITYERFALFPISE